MDTSCQERGGEGELEKELYATVDHCERYCFIRFIPKIEEYIKVKTHHTKPDYTKWLRRYDYAFSHLQSPSIKPLVKNLNKLTKAQLEHVYGERARVITFMRGYDEKREINFTKYLSVIKKFPGIIDNVYWSLNDLDNSKKERASTIEGDEDALNELEREYEYLKSLCKFTEEMIWEYVMSKKGEKHNVYWQRVAVQIFDGLDEKMKKQMMKFHGLTFFDQDYQGQYETNKNREKPSQLYGKKSKATDALDSGLKERIDNDNSQEEVSNENCNSPNGGSKGKFRLNIFKNF